MLRIDSFISLLNKIPHFVRNDSNISINRRERESDSLQLSLSRSLSYSINIMSFRMDPPAGGEMRNLNMINICLCNFSN